MKIDNLEMRSRADITHASNVAAGWWSDINTGKSILETRNRPELMLLVISEVSEADHGEVQQVKDDKLPHLEMFDVELADVAIRLFDMMGAENSLYGYAVEYDFNKNFEIFVRNLLNASHERRLLEIVNTVSAAMEHIRKGRIEPYRLKLAETQAMTFAVAEINGIDLFSVIDEKIAFNKNRPDHKIENRQKSDGKKF